MHLESYFDKRNCISDVKVHRQIDFDRKEFEKIMLREFGKRETVLYRTPQKVITGESKPGSYTVKQRCFIVDGYNVIFAWEFLKELSEFDLESARIKLCHILSNYAHFTGSRVIVVFDGYKVHGNIGEKYDFQGVNVVFTKENETADTYIENLIAEIGQNEQIRVVTSDGMIQLKAVKTGVIRMSSYEFLEEVENRADEIREIIGKTDI